MAPLNFWQWVLRFSLTLFASHSAWSYVLLDQADLSAPQIVAAKYDVIFAGGMRRR